MSFSIQVDTDQLLTTANMLNSFSDSLHLQQQRLGSHIETFNHSFYNGTVQRELTAQWEALASPIQALTHQAENLSNRLQKLADRILEADNFSSTNVPNGVLQSEIWEYLAPVLGGKINLLPIFSTLPELLSDLPRLPEDSYFRTGDAFSKAYGLAEKLGEYILKQELGKVGGAITGSIADLIGKRLDDQPINGETATTVGITNALYMHPKLRVAILASDALQLGGNWAIETNQWLLQEAALSDGMRHEIDRTANTYQHHFQALDLDKAIESGVGLGVHTVAHYITGKDYSQTNQTYMQNLKDFAYNLGYIQEETHKYLAVGATTVGANILSHVSNIPDKDIDQAATTVLRVINNFDAPRTVINAGSILSGGKNLLDKWIW